MREESDHEVMMRVKAGRIDDLSILFERYQSKLTGFFARMSGSLHVAEDLVQEVFIRIMRYRKSFRGEGRGFRTWMFTLARRVFQDHLSRAARRPELDEIGARDLPSQESSPDEHLFEKESLALLQRALLLLHEEKRTILLLRRFHFKSFGEIAEILGCSEGAARVRAHRAIREVRRIYEGLADEVNHEV